mmetsp:Transcript_40316/g.46255  ORF Transcript_40316/g.46255 Transcript_40316/m.46255 type:complete len:164 (+) Transcript_40316:1979-2470(+)
MEVDFPDDGGAQEGIDGEAIQDSDWLDTIADTNEYKWFSAKVTKDVFQKIKLEESKAEIKEPDHEVPVETTPKKLAPVLIEFSPARGRGSIFARGRASINARGRGRGVRGSRGDHATPFELHSPPKANLKNSPVRSKSNSDMESSSEKSGDASSSSLSVEENN